MFRQLVKEWREQAELYQGNRKRVFELCADQLEDLILAVEEESNELKSTTIEPRETEPDRVSGVVLSLPMDNN